MRRMRRPTPADFRTAQWLTWGALLLAVIGPAPAGAQLPLPPDPSGGRPPVLRAPASTPTTESPAPPVPLPPPAPAGKPERVQGVTGPEARKVPQVTSFPELVESEGDSQALLRE